MEVFKDIVVSHTTFPTYLLELLQTDEDILLFHCKKKIVEPSIISTDTADVSINSTMNLTGCPLEVDLNVLPSVAAFHLIGDKNFHEDSHLPMKLEMARKCLRDYKRVSKEFVNNFKAMYCVCDGNNSRCIVVIGCHASGKDAIRTLCFLEECVDESYPAENINSMIQKHYANVGTDAIKVETKITCIFELYGFKLCNDYLLDDLEYTGSVLIEACWNSCVYNIPQHGAKLKMMLQIIIGHEESLMHQFFKEHVFLQNCFEILSKKGRTLDDAIISNFSCDVADVNKSITEILHAVHVMKKPTNSEDVNNVAEMSLTDKLYEVLKNCEKVSDLRICFDHLFESVCDTMVTLQTFGNDKDTVVGKMIADISSGKLNVRYLSPEQSLELLIDLGIQKLKHSYFSIVQSFDFLTSQQLTQNWNNIGSFMTETRRGTFVGHNLNQGSLQLQYLWNIHVCLEFLKLVEKNCCFSKEASIPVMKHACNKYVTELKSSNLPILEKKQLYDLEVPLTFAVGKSIEDCTPIKWQMKMTSLQRNSSVVTVFHYSKKPIFVSAVYNSYDADRSSLDVKEKFYAARLERYSDKIC